MAHDPVDLSIGAQVRSGYSGYFERSSKRVNPNNSEVKLAVRKTYTEMAALQCRDISGEWWLCGRVNRPPSQGGGLATDARHRIYRTRQRAAAPAAAPGGNWHAVKIHRVRGGLRDAPNGHTTR